MADFKFSAWSKQSSAFFRGQVHGSAHAPYIKMLFFCRDMLYHLCKQYDHVIMLSKNQSAHSPGSHLHQERMILSCLHLINLNICK